MMIEEMFRLAAETAMQKTDINNKRTFYLGAIGKRRDGAIVRSHNEATAPMQHYRPILRAHAEGRCIVKLGKEGILYIARVRRIDLKYGNSMPCKMCQIIIRAARTKVVYHTIDHNCYGIWIPSTNEYRVCRF